MIGAALKEVLRERDTTVSELSRRTGIPVQTLYSIIRRDSVKVDCDSLMRICEELGVPIERLYNGKVSEIKGAVEWDLIRRYRLLDDHGRKIVELIIEAELERTTNPG